MNSRRRVTPLHEASDVNIRMKRSRSLSSSDDIERRSRSSSPDDGKNHVVVHQSLHHPTQPYPEVELNQCTYLYYHGSPHKDARHTPVWFTQCTSLKSIEILAAVIRNEEWLTALPPTLTEITLEHAYLPSHLAHLTRLESLEVHNSMTLTNLMPVEVNCLVNLHTLIVIGCELEHLGVLDNLVHLQHLDLSSNMITEVPESFSSLTSLRTLSLSYNKIKTLPMVLGALVHLMSLELRDNQFSEVPPVIYSTAIREKLRKLDMRRNLLTSLPNAFCVNMPMLSKLQLGSNEMMTAGSWWHFPSLRTIDLSHCDLVALPRLSPETTQLMHIDINNNNLTAVPRQFLALLKHELFLNIRNNPDPLVWECAILSLVFKKATFHGVPMHMGIQDSVRRGQNQPYIPHTTLGEYMTHCIRQIMLMRQYINQAEKQSLVVDIDALSYNISSHVVSLFRSSCIAAVRFMTLVAL